MKRIAISMTFLAVMASSSFAGNIVLKNGAEFDAVVISESKGMTTLRIEGGEITMPSSMIQTAQKPATLSLEAIQKQEQTSREKLVLANQERRDRLNQFNSEEEARHISIVREAEPASYLKELSQQLHSGNENLDQIAARIQAKLDLFEEMLPQLESVRFGDKNRLRQAVLSEIFPNYQAPLVVW